MYMWKYRTPEGFADLYMSSDGEYLTGLWFEESRDAGKHGSCFKETNLPVFERTCEWLDSYFGGMDPDFFPEYQIKNLTPFRAEVIGIMKEIPYGKTMTYGEIAARIAKNRGIRRMSAQAVGQAVGWNPICILIPCHRVVGSDGSLTGYGGGIRNKEALLRLERECQ